MTVSEKLQIKIMFHKIQSSREPPAGFLQADSQSTPCNNKNFDEQITVALALYRNLIGQMR